MKKVSLEENLINDIKILFQKLSKEKIENVLSYEDEVMELHERTDRISIKYNEYVNSNFDKLSSFIGFFTAEEVVEKGKVKIIGFINHLEKDNCESCLSDLNDSYLFHLALCFVVFDLNNALKEYNKQKEIKHKQTVN